MRNDLEIIGRYFADRRISFMSFDGLMSRVHPRFTREYMIELIEQFPANISLGTLKGNVPGIKLLK
jgi:hypothetical protein